MKRVKIKMLKSARGSDRNFSGIAEPLKLYEKGKCYDVDESLAQCFFDDKIKAAEKAPLLSKFENEKKPKKRPTKESLAEEKENKAQ